MEDLSDIAPDATRVECKLLVRSIRDIEIKYHGDPSVTPVEAFDASATSSSGADNDVIGAEIFRMHGVFDTQAILEEPHVVTVHCTHE